MLVDLMRPQSAPTIQDVAQILTLRATTIPPLRMIDVVSAKGSHCASPALLLTATCKVAEIPFSLATVPDIVLTRQEQDLAGQTSLKRIEKV